MGANYPPGCTGAEPQISGWAEWERWADSLKAGDPCLAYGRVGYVTAVAGERVWVTFGRPEDPTPVDWEDVAPPFAGSRHTPPKAP